MRQLPILFSTPMVEAILENRKTMTRRTRGLEKVNENPDNWQLVQILNLALEKRYMAEFKNTKDGTSGTILIPISIGDQLYVKETWCEPVLYGDCEKDYYYKADYPNGISVDYDSEHISGKWRPSLFMPKEAARLWLEITDVSCERLQLISHTDAIAEGIKFMHGIEFTKHYNYVEKEFTLRYPSHSFFSLWRSINGKDSVAANPWVFVYTFKRIEKQ